MAAGVSPQCEGSMDVPECIRSDFRFADIRRISST
jgi:hypothetical protein